MVIVLSWSFSNFQFSQISNQSKWVWFVYVFCQIISICNSGLGIIETTVYNWLKRGEIVASWRWLYSKSFPSINYTIKISLILITIENIKNLQYKNLMQWWNHKEVVLSKKDFIWHLNSISNHFVCLQAVCYWNPVVGSSKTFWFNCADATPHIYFTLRFGRKKPRPLGSVEQWSPCSFVTQKSCEIQLLQLIPTGRIAFASQNFFNRL